MPLSSSCTYLHKLKYIIYTEIPFSVFCIYSEWFPWVVVIYINGKSKRVSLVSRNPFRNQKKPSSINFMIIRWSRGEAIMLVKLSIILFSNSHNFAYCAHTVYAEIFAEQEANRIFAIIFSRITGSSWKGSMLCTVTNLQLLQTSKFSRIKFSLYQ